MSELEIETRICAAKFDFILAFQIRYGIFDEFGFAFDAVYPNYFRVGGNILPTGTSNEPVVGAWKNEVNQERLKIMIFEIVVNRN